MCGPRSPGRTEGQWTSPRLPDRSRIGKAAEVVVEELPPPRFCFHAKAEAATDSVPALEDHRAQQAKRLSGLTAQAPARLTRGVRDLQPLGFYVVRSGSSTNISTARSGS